MVGDRADTDLQFGINAGIDTCLVFTGVIKDQNDLRDWGIRPNLLLESFGEDIGL